MTTSSRHGLFKQRGLTQTELTDIRRLADLCNTYGGLDLKLNWSSLPHHSRNSGEWAMARLAGGRDGK
ncbi:MAG TPA: hypothetical protein VKY19_23400 [Ktedonosporobacter sp.]|jgi:hypothetical protein|nr:hypothetical protein [Ktedonosporobacter sp.]